MYGGVPPLNVAERMVDCPASRTDGVAVGVETVRGMTAGVTVRAELPELAAYRAFPP